MSFRTQSDSLVGAFSNTINGLAVGNTSLGNTDPNMTFMPLFVILETVAITGSASLAPTISTGITAANYTDISPNNTNNNLKTLHGVGRQSIESLGNATIAPNSQIFCRVSSAATVATVLTIRVSIIGLYY